MVEAAIATLLRTYSEGSYSSGCDDASCCATLVASRRRNRGSVRRRWFVCVSRRDARICAYVAAMRGCTSRGRGARIALDRVTVGRGCYADVPCSVRVVVRRWPEMRRRHVIVDNRSLTYTSFLPLTCCNDSASAGLLTRKKQQTAIEGPAHIATPPHSTDLSCRRHVVHQVPCLHTLFRRRHGIVIN